MSQTTVSTFVLKDYIPYIVSIVCALISGIVSYCIARRQLKADINKVEKQFQLDLEKEREKFKLEKERMELEHKYQMELKQKELEGTLNDKFMTSLVSEAIKNPDVQRQLHTGISAGMRKKGRRSQ